MFLISVLNVGGVAVAEQVFLQQQQSINCQLFFFWGGAELHPASADLVCSLALPIGAGCLEETPPTFRLITTSVVVSYSL